MARNADISLKNLQDRIQSEADAYLFMEELRWGDRPFCPVCHSEAVNYIRPLNGESRLTNKGKQSQRRVWKCQACPGRKQFSVLTGTVMHGTKISVKTWLFVMFEMMSSKNGVSAREIERKYELTPKSAWFLLHRIREAMAIDPIASMLGGNGGTVVADETFIGGKPKNKHQQGRPIRLPGGGRGRAGAAADKVAVLSLIDTETGEARSRIVPDVTGATLAKAISEQVDMTGSVLHTDGWMGYRQLGAQFQEHAYVDHSAHEYVRYTTRGVVTSNQAENFFSQLKRSIDGTHHHISTKHLPRYLGEFDFRYSTRDLTDAARMRRLLGQTADRRLTYRPLTGR